MGAESLAVVFPARIGPDVNYPALTDGASRFIDTLTPGILAKYSIIAEAFSSSGVSPTFHRESPSFNMTIAEATSLSNVELQEGQVNCLSDRLSLTRLLQTGQTPVVLTNLPTSTGVLAFLFKASRIPPMEVP